MDETPSTTATAADSRKDIERRRTKHGCHRHLYNPVARKLITGTEFWVWACGCKVVMGVPRAEADIWCITPEQLEQMP